MLFEDLPRNKSIFILITPVVHQTRKLKSLWNKDNKLENVLHSLSRCCKCFVMEVDAIFEVCADSEEKLMTNLMHLILLLRRVNLK